MMSSSKHVVLDCALSETPPRIKKLVENKQLHPSH